MVVKRASLNNMCSQNMLKLHDKFATEICRTLWVEESGKTHEFEVIIFQLGSNNVEVRNLESDVVRVQAEIPDYIQVKVKHWDLEGIAKENTLKSNFARLGTAAVGKSNVHKDSKLLPRDSLFNRTYKKDTVQLLEGTVKVDRAKIETVLKRSGADGIIIDSTEIDESISLINAPPHAATIEKAYQVAHSMGDLAYGVTVTQFGLRIRVKVGTEEEAKAAMDPDLAEAIGDKLLRCRKPDGLVLHATGLPHAMTDAEVVRALTISPLLNADPSEKAWTCAPFALHSRHEWGKKTLVVKALCQPRKYTIRVEYRGRTYPVFLVPQEERRSTG